MADKLKYSTTQPTLPGLRTDDFVLGTGDGSYGPTSTTSYLNGFTAPEGGYVVYTLGLNNTPIGWVAANDNELIDISRHLGNLDLTIKSAKVYLSNLTDTWIFSSTPKNIVTDSLVFNIDIKNLTSYPDAEVNVYDISGEGNNGTLVNGVGRNSNGWLLFDGVDDYVEPSTTFSFPGEFTVTCVFKQDTASERSFLGRVEGSTKLIFLSNYNIFFRMIDGGSAVNFPIGYGSSNLGKWNYITATRDGDGTIKASLNGEPYTTNAVRTGTFQPNLIGKNNSGQFWDGGISNMRIYDRSFTEAEIKQNYYGGPIVTDGLELIHDASNLVSFEPGTTETYSLTGSYDGNLVNAVEPTPNKGGSWQFDGADARIELPSIGATQVDDPDLSVFAWVYYDGNTGTNGIWGHGANSGQNCHFEAYSSYTRIRLGAASTTSLPVLPTNEWVYVGFTSSNTTHKYFVNGKLTSTFTGNTGGILGPGGFVHCWGDSNAPVRPWNGQISSGKVYLKALTDAEVQQNFEAHRSRFGV